MTIVSVLFRTDFGDCLHAAQLEQAPDANCIGYPVFKFEPEGFFQVGRDFLQRAAAALGSVLSALGLTLCARPVGLKCGDLRIRRETA